MGWIMWIVGGIGGWGLGHRLMIGENAKSPVAGLFAVTEMA